MPIDTSMFFSLKPVESDPPGTAAARLQSLKALADEQEARRIQFENTKLEQTQRLQAVQDSETIKQAWAEVDGDINLLPKAIAGKVSPAAMMNLQNTLLAHRKSVAELSKAERENAKAEAEKEGAIAQGILLQPREQWPALYAQSLAQHPNDHWPAEFPGEDFLKLRSIGAKTAVQLVEEYNKQQDQKRAAAKEERDAALFPYDKITKEAEAKLKTAEAAGQKPIQPYEQAQLDKSAAHVTEPELAVRATDPNRTPEQRAADEAALQRLDKSKRESRPVINNLGPGGTPTDAKDIAQGIINGKQSPMMTGLYRLTGPVRAMLARDGYDLATAQRDWQAVQKHLATLNGPQQERLRQAITFTHDSLGTIRGLYDEWKQLAPVSGFKDLNKATLAAMKRLPGRAGAVATMLESQINDLVSELGTVYKGGNSSTDETLRLASGNLKAEWNDLTFRRGLDLIERNLRIRKNSIDTSEAVGISENSPYAPKHETQQPVQKWVRDANGNPVKQ